MLGWSGLNDWRIAIARSTARTLDMSVSPDVGFDLGGFTIRPRLASEIRTA
jgi:hypothetical protein